jgi:hypothetical protein
MSKILKLTRLIININYIHSIDINPNKYYVNIISNKFDGSTWSGFGGFGYGSISSDNYGVEVCETKNSIDYKIVSNWIDNH